MRVWDTAALAWQLPVTRPKAVDLPAPLPLRERGSHVVGKWFGSFNDSTPEATERMNERFLTRAKQKAASEGAA